jgi:hypothetical protein
MEETPRADFATRSKNRHAVLTDERLNSEQKDFALRWETVEAIDRLATAMELIAQAAHFMAMNGIPRERG